MQPHDRNADNIIIINNQSPIIIIIIIIINELTMVV